MTKSIALIVGAGEGLSASLARLLAGAGYEVVLAARNIDKLKNIAAETKATTFQCDASDPQQVAALFSSLKIGRAHV